MKKEICFNREKTVCFTGYRSNKFPFEFINNNESYNSFEITLFNIIEECIKDGYSNYLIGGCEGFDILAGELINLSKKVFDNFKIKLFVIVPFIGQENNWNNFWKERYQSIINSADNIIVLSEKYFTGAYYTRNRYIVDNSSLIITFYDGKSGGTKYTLDYNSQNNKNKVINIAEEANWLIN